jgi:NACHT domain
MLTQIGKTVLASVVVEECLEDKSFTTIFFYCKHDDPEKNSCNSIFKSLLSQLITECRGLVPFCHDKYLASGELTLNSAKLIKQLLELFCDSLAKQYIIIDGLDECSKGERNLVMSFFNSLVDRHDAKAPGRTRILFISQDEIDIEKGLSTAAVIKVNATDNEDDIRRFVRESSRRIQTKYELDDLQVEKIMNSTCARAEGNLSQLGSDDR